MTSPSDHDLIRAVATNRDRLAFEELYRRHERAAFNLAAFLTGQRDLAEEAVQDGMLRVWKHAHTLRDDGNARGWLLRVIARAAVKVAANQRKTREREANKEAMEQHAAPAVRVVEGAVEQEEAQAALRTELHKLSDENRQLVALYFGAGFTQAEISQELDLSQTAVSARLRRVLETLRTRLSASGFAAAVPLLGTEGLANAIHGGVDVPPSLGDRVFARLDQAARNSGRVAGGAALSKWTLVGIALVATVAAGGTWWGVGRMSATADSPQPQGMQSVSEDIHAAKLAEEAKPLYAKWDFTKGPVPAIKLERGEGHWEKTKDGGAFVASKKPGAYLLLPAGLPAGPVIARIKGRIDRDKSGDFFLGGFWADGQNLVPNKHWSKYNKFKDLSGNAWALNCTIYLADRYMIVQHEGMTSLIREAAKPYPGTTLLLNVSNVSLISIELRSIHEDEIPQVLRDVPVCIRALGSKPLVMEKDGTSHEMNSSVP